MIWPFDGKSYRDDEADMTSEDWALRGFEQAKAMSYGGSWEDSSPDESGHPTGGEYNGDYTDAVHDQLNQRLSDDPNYANEVAADLRTLLRADTQRRSDQGLV